jgi:hypothetical protein
LDSIGTCKGWKFILNQANNPRANRDPGLGRLVAH